MTDHDDALCTVCDHIQSVHELPGCDHEFVPVVALAPRVVELITAGTVLALQLDCAARGRGSAAANTVTQLVQALDDEHRRANALERIINDPEAIPRQVGRLTDAVEALREAIPALREAIPQTPPSTDANSAICRCGHRRDAHAGVTNGGYCMAECAVVCNIFRPVHQAQS